MHGHCRPSHTISAPVHRVEWTLPATRLAGTRQAGTGTSLGQIMKQEPPISATSDS